MLAFFIAALVVASRAMFEDEVGKIDWSHESVGSPRVTLSLPRLRLLILGSDSFLTAVSITNGAVHWRIPAASPIISLQSSDEIDTALIVLSADSQVMLIDPTDGSIVVVTSPPAPDAPALAPTAAVLPVGLVHKAVVSIAFDAAGSVYNPNITSYTATTTAALSVDPRGASVIAALSGTLTLVTVPFEVRPRVDDTPMRVAFGEPTSATLPAESAAVVVASIAAVAAGPLPFAKGSWSGAPQRALLEAAQTARAVVYEEDRKAKSTKVAAGGVKGGYAAPTALAYSSSSRTFRAATMLLLRRVVPLAVAYTQCGLVDAASLVGLYAARDQRTTAGYIYVHAGGSTVAPAGSSGGSEEARADAAAASPSFCKVAVMTFVSDAADAASRSTAGDGVVGGGARLDVVRVQQGSALTPSLRANRIDGVAAAAAVAVAARRAVASEAPLGDARRDAALHYALGVGPVGARSARETADHVPLPLLLEGVWGAISADATKSLSLASTAVAAASSAASSTTSAFLRRWKRWQRLPSIASGSVSAAPGVRTYFETSSAVVVELVELPPKLSSAADAKGKRGTHAAVVVDGRGRVGVMVRVAAVPHGSGETVWQLQWARDESISLSTAGALAALPAAAVEAALLGNGWGDDEVYMLDFNTSTLKAARVSAAGEESGHGVQRSDAIGVRVGGSPAARAAAAASTRSAYRQSLLSRIVHRWASTVATAVVRSQWLIHTLQAHVAAAVGARAAAVRHSNAAVVALQSHRARVGVFARFLGLESAAAAAAVAGGADAATSGDQKSKGESDAAAAAAAAASAASDAAAADVAALVRRGGAVGLRRVLVVGTAVGSVAAHDVGSGVELWTTALPAPCSRPVVSITAQHTYTKALHDVHDDIVVRTPTCVAVLRVRGGGIAEVERVSSDSVLIPTTYTAGEGAGASSHSAAGAAGGSVSGGAAVSTVRAVSLIVDAPRDVAGAAAAASIATIPSSPSASLVSAVRKGALTAFRGASSASPRAVVGLRVVEANASAASAAAAANAAAGSAVSLAGEISWVWTAPEDSAIVACASSSTPTSTLASVERRTPNIVGHTISGHTSAVGVPASEFVVVATMGAPAMALELGGASSAAATAGAAASAEGGSASAAAAAASGKVYVGDELTVTVLDGSSGQVVDVVIFQHATGPVNVVGFDTMFLVTFFDAKKARGRVVSLHLLDTATVIPRSVRAVFGGSGVAARGREGASSTVKVDVQGYQVDSGLVAVAPVVTRHSLVQRNVILGYPNGRVYLVASRQLDMPNYTYIAPNLTDALTYNHTVPALHSVVSAATLLESTSVVCAVGADVFCAHVRPIPFDVVPDSFAYTPLVLAVLGVTIATLVVQWYAARADANRNWGPEVESLAAATTDAVRR